VAGLTLTDFTNGDVPECDEGYYCESGAFVSAPTDTVGDSDFTGAICPVGKYCPRGSDAPTDCPAGTFNAFTGQYDETEHCVDCPGGYYCESDGLDIYTG
jgi:hypothetical protein